MKKKLTQETIENVRKYENESPKHVSENLSRAISRISGFQNEERTRLSLKDVFDVQEGLNDLIFFKSDLRSTDGNLLSVEKLMNLARTRPATANSDSIEWIRRFVRALKDETRELEDELVWKWWSKDKADTQNIKVEIADHLFFLICIAQAAGMSAEDLFSAYMQKAIVNFERQFGGYSAKNKTEEDNQEIEVGA